MFIYVYSQVSLVCMYLFHAASVRFGYQVYNCYFFTTVLDNLYKNYFVFFFKYLVKLTPECTWACSIFVGRF